MTVSLKEGGLVLVSDEDGSLPLGRPGGTLGLYYRDTQHLSGFQVKVNGKPSVLLSANTEQNYVATFQLVGSTTGITTTSDRHGAEMLSVRHTRFLADAWRERIGVLNCSPTSTRVRVDLEFAASFRDMFAVRGYQRVDNEPNGPDPEQLEDGIRFVRQGRDGVVRSTEVTVMPTPDERSARGFSFERELPPQGVITIELRITPREDGRPVPGTAGFDRELDDLNARYQRFLRSCARYETSSESLNNELITRSALDLRALMDFEETGPFPTAGIPWYAVPFGRDGLICAYQTLGWNPDIARGTLRMLAQHQGTKIDPFTEEEPGKIFHELRRGELARLGEVPHRPYYGSIDSTPLFAFVFAETVKWTADRELWRELLPAAERALAWCDAYGDMDGDGYVEYGARASFIRNQGWKDSPLSLSEPDGSWSKLPAALVEVQAYVYAAKMGMAELYAIEGASARAEELTRQATELAARFDRDFWMPDEGCYAQALDGDKRQVRAVTSNAGHALWCRIAPPERAKALVLRLMRPDMFSGWGIRTLSSGYPTFNPMSYHNGSVWPHDNSLIAHGFARYGFRDEAAAIVEALFEAGKKFPYARLPELFCGFTRDLRFASRPADYLVSCIPQAWSAGMVFLCLRALLGLEPDLRSSRLIADPALPGWLDCVEVKDLRVYGERLHFEIRRAADGHRLAGENASVILREVEAA